MSKTAKILINTLMIDKETWREYRRVGIGGSDVGSICGINPYSSPMRVYLDKIGEAPEIEENEKMYWGTTLEEIVAKEFAKRTGKKVKRRNAMLQHPEYEFMLANVDREVIGENSVLECKTASAHMEKIWEEGVPDSYMLQIQHYMMVGGYDKAYIACLCGGNHFIFHEVPRDEEIIKYIKDIELDFWHNHVEKRIPPEVDGSKATEEALAKLYPRAKEISTVMQLDSRMNALLKSRESYKSGIAELQQEVDKIDNEVKSILQDSDKAESNDYFVTWKNCNGKESFDTKLFKKDHPELVDKYLKHGKDYRTLSIKSKEMDNNGRANSNNGIR